MPTLAGLLERAAARFGGAGVIFEDDRRSYPDLFAAATAYARRLRALGVQPGETIGIFMGDRPEYLAAVYGAARVGVVAAPINSRFKARELRHAITSAELRVVICGGDSDGFVDYAGLVEEALGDLDGQDANRLELSQAPALRQVVAVESVANPAVMTMEAFAAGEERAAAEEIDELQARIELGDTAMILFTSGTTAMPKGCVISHSALVRPAYAMVDRFLLTTEDRMWDPLPFFHLASLLPLHACMVAGSSYCAMRRFEPGAALEMMERERCTTAFPAFETIWLAVLNHPRFDSTDLGSLRLVLNVGTRERLEQMQRRLPQAIQISSYGCTELGGVIAFGHVEDPLELRVTTSGRPFPGMEIRIVDPETGEELPPGRRGEIVGRGHSMFSGYFDEPALTAKAIDHEGWFHTGDLGELDEEGRVKFRGRLKDMLKVGGENVAGAEIEDYLLTHDAVEIVQVVGVRDARYDEVPCAFVQLRAGATATEQELIDFCLGEIATFKVPRYVRFVDAWPMSGTKVQKFRLRERITEELDAAGVTEAPRLRSKV